MVYSVPEGRRCSRMEAIEQLSIGDSILSGTGTRDGRYPEWAGLKLEVITPLFIAFLSRFERDAVLIERHS